MWWPSWDSVLICSLFGSHNADVVAYSTVLFILCTLYCYLVTTKASMPALIARTVPNDRPFAKTLIPELNKGNDITFNIDSAVVKPMLRKFPRLRKGTVETSTIDLAKTPEQNAFAIGHSSRKLFGSQNLVRSAIENCTPTCVPLSRKRGIPPGAGPNLPTGTRAGGRLARACSSKTTEATQQCSKQGLA